MIFLLYFQVICIFDTDTPYHTIEEKTYSMLLLTI